MANNDDKQAVTVDTPEFRGLLATLVEAGDYGPDVYCEARAPFIAHIDAHTSSAVARAVAEKDAEIKRMTAALDAQGELTNRYQEIALSAQTAAPVAASDLHAWEALRADVLHGVDGLDNDQVNIVLGMIDYYTPAHTKQPAAVPAEQVQNNDGVKPAGFDVCPISGRPFWGNIDHPERGMLATYGGPFDTYSIPYLDDDDELRVERFDQDRGEWVEGGEPFGWYYSEQQPEYSAPTQPPAGELPVLPDLFAEFCEREGYPSDGPFGAALRKAFDAGCQQGRAAGIEEAAKVAATIYSGNGGPPDDPHPDSVIHNGAVNDCVSAIRSLNKTGAK